MNLLADTRLYSPGNLCRLPDHLIEDIRQGHRLGALYLSACLTIVIGSAIYGWTFGQWRGGGQAWISALKYPLLFFSVAGCSALVNTMLAQVSGAKLGFRQVLICMLVSMAIASAILGSLSPVMLYFLSNAPRSNGDNAMRVYSIMLLFMTSGVGFAGIVGHVMLFNLLKRVIGSAKQAGRILLYWIGVSGFAGCQLSWMISPFLAKPNEAIPLINPDAFNGNFFEYVWRALSAMG